MPIDPQPGEQIGEHACVNLSHRLWKKGLVPIYHCVQSEGRTSKFVMSCYIPGILTTGRV